MQEKVSHYKAEFLYVNEFKTVEEFLIGLDKYIYYYNNHRIVTKLKMTPIEYRDHCLANI